MVRILIRCASPLLLLLLLPLLGAGCCHPCHAPHLEQHVCAPGCHHGPLLPHLARKAHCANSWGEVYWGEWISDPPDRCDPCDDCGNWVGHGPCCVPSIHQLWGLRYDGCDCCGGPHHVDAHHGLEGEVIWEEGEPTYAGPMPSLEVPELLEQP